jgi:lipopolysaccharide transport system permease protein
MTAHGEALGQTAARNVSVDPKRHAPPARPEFVVEPRRGWEALNLRELWQYRELLYFLTWRDIKVRYKQTAIGAAWAILQPLLTMLAFSVIFGQLIGVPSDGAPYPVFAYVALLPWTFFATAFSRCAVSLVSDANLVSKVYFPRLVLPVSAVLAIAVDAGIAFAILLGLLAVYRILPGIGVVTLPLFFGLAFLTALGVGLWVAALNVKYRDVAHALPFLIQVWLFATPVAYSSSIVPEPWRLLYAVNPMVGVVAGFRWALLGTPSPLVEELGVSTAAALAVFASGLLYFDRTQDEFADVI